MKTGRMEEMALMELMEKMAQMEGLVRLVNSKTLNDSKFNS